jgi:hypothetical protein
MQVVPFGVHLVESIWSSIWSSETLCGDRDALTREKGPAPTPVEIQEWSEAFVKAEEARKAAQKEVTAAAERLTAAKNWATLEAKCCGLKQQIQDADTRAAAAERIRVDNTRLDELAAAVPALRQLLSLRKDLVDTERLFTVRQVEANRLSAALRAKELREQIGQDIKCLEAAEGMKKLRDELGGFDPNLAEQLVAAQERIRLTTGAETAALQAKAAVAELLKKAKGQ